ncbi:cytochrome c biogenesis protein [Methanosarcina sp. Mfa9]|uniref:cytochrome c biogenesis protein n=1 Tax=Methanosarcina sp. Mfa9 TaxID=3439063 RepID=UPI003F86C278
MKKLPAPQRHAIDIKPGLKICLLLLIGLLSFSPAPAYAAGNETVSVEYFYEEGCLKCQQALPVVGQVVKSYPDANFSIYEIMSSYTRMKEYRITTVPTIVVNRSTVITYRDYEGNETILKTLLEEAIENSTLPPFPAGEPPAGESSDYNNETNNETPEELNGEKMNPFFILAAGILAGFNPCLLAVMAFLASITLSQQGGKREMLKITAGFSAGIFVMYMVAGISILGTVSFIPRIRETVTTFLALMTGIVGLWHIYDAYRLKVDAKSTFKTPRALKNFMERIGKKNLLLLSFLAGGMFSLVKAPCVGAIYLSILNMLVTKTGMLEGAFYLAIYNLGLVLPVIGLGILLTIGMSPETVTEFREKRRVEIRLVTGLILIALALLMQFRIL